MSDLKEHPATEPASSVGLPALMLGVGVMFASSLYEGIGAGRLRLALLVGGICVVAFATVCLMFRRGPALWPGLLAPTGVLAGLVALMLLRGQAPDTVRTHFFFVIVVTFFYAGWLGGTLRPPALAAIPRSLLALLLVFLLGAILWYRLVESTVAQPGARLSGSVDLNPVGVAYVMGVCIALAVVLGLWSRGWLRPLLAALAVPVLLLDFFGAASRGATVALVGAVGFVVAASLWRDPAERAEHRIGRKLLIVTVALVGGLLIFQQSLLLAQAEVLLERFDSLANPYGDRSSYERLFIWQKYWALLDEFWLLGLPGYDGLEYPHNLFYEMWVRFGLLGWVLIAATLAAALKLALGLALRRLTLVDLFFAALFAFGFINGQFNLSLEHNRAFWLGLGYVLARNWSMLSARRPPAGVAPANPPLTGT